MATDTNPEEYSLLDKFAGQLSRHLFFHLLDFEAGKAADAGDEQKEREVLEAKIKLLEGTNMSDYVASLYSQLHGTDPPEKYAKQRQVVLQQMEKFVQDTARLSELLITDEVVNHLRSDKVANLAFLEKEHGVSNQSFSDLFSPLFCCVNSLECVAWLTGILLRPIGHYRHGQRALRLWPVPVPMR